MLHLTLSHCAALSLPRVQPPNTSAFSWSCEMFLSNNLGCLCRVTSKSCSAGSTARCCRQSCPSSCASCTSPECGATLLGLSQRLFSSLFPSSPSGQSPSSTALFFINNTYKQETELRPGRTSEDSSHKPSAWPGSNCVKSFSTVSQAGNQQRI